METTWFAILSCMLAVYVVLDGFDFGAGILHLFVAKTDEERRTVLASIGPVWDGNEVWLIASGGVMVFAFPKAYAAGFSGFYLALMMVLWLLILRALSIEFRSKEKNRLWRSFFDGVFAFSSILMAIVLGAALGNVIRGVPLDASGYFSCPLFTNFLPGRDPGILDFYTVIVGVFTLLVLAGHGALYLGMKTEGEIQKRSMALARVLWTLVAVFGIVTTAATQYVQPTLYASLISRPWTWVLAVGVALSLVNLFVSMAKKRETAAFLSSSAFIVCLLAATAAGVYPNMLVSTHSPQFTITAFNATAGTRSLSVGLAIWTVAIVLAIGYFVYVYRLFRGKVVLDADGHGY